MVFSFSYWLCLEMLLSSRMFLPALSASNLLMVVALKLPLFWPENIETWFVEAKSQFQLKGVVVSQTKFDYFGQSKMQEVAVKVLNLIRNPPDDDPYQTLKDRLQQLRLR